jgi:peptidoglycan hydrolase-like protein with peptidoglycan-binding domain
VSNVRSKRVVVIVITIVVIGGGVGWWGTTRIKSPAQLAAESAPPAASLITVPVQKLTLSADVITRGTVRHRGQVKVNVASSALKPSSAGLVTLAPEKGAQLEEGKVALAVGGRPVFVLKGAVPAFRDLSLGAVGDDVRQLEEALQRLGFDPGPVDGVYDAATAAGVTAWYEKAGWTPFGPTDQQRQAVTTARDTATKAQQARFQADLALAQTRLQLQTDQTTAVAVLAAAETKAPTAAGAAISAARTVDAAKATADRDLAVANADVATKTAALHTAEAARTDAQNLAKTPPLTATPAEIAILQANVVKANEAAAVATSDLAAAQSNLTSVKIAGAAAVLRAQDDVVVAQRDATAAQDDLARAQAGVDRATNRITSTPRDVSLLSRAADAAMKDEASATAEFQALSDRTGIQVPADEVLFFPDLPRRVDDVKVKRGDPVTAELLTVSGLALSIDTSLSSNDAKLVNVGAKVAIEEPDLGIKAAGSVTARSEQPGTNAVEPQKFYVEVTPDNAPDSLVGASVKLTIPVKSTAGDVLVVPLSALAVGASGSSRVEVVAGATTRFVDVVPGLVAQGLVEVTAPAGGIAEGDNVVVGRSNERQVLPASGQSTNPPAAAATATATTSSTGAQPNGG